MPTLLILLGLAVGFGVYLDRKLRPGTSPPLPKSLADRAEAIDDQMEKERIKSQEAKDADKAAQKENLLRAAEKKAASEGHATHREGNAVIPQAMEMDEEETRRNFMQWAAKNMAGAKKE